MGYQQVLSSLVNSSGVYGMRDFGFQYYNHVYDCRGQFMNRTRRSETAVFQIRMVLVNWTHASMVKHTNQHAE